MALGALEALRADGRAGKVPVTGIDGIQLAVEAIMAGEMAGTVAWDPYWQGGMGLSIGYHAKTGKFDPAKEPKEHREFYGTGVVITAENAEEFYDDQHQGRAQARLERHLGPRRPARSSTAEPARGSGAVAVAAGPSRRRPAARRRAAGGALRLGPGRRSWCWSRSAS